MSILRKLPPKTVTLLLCLFLLTISRAQNKGQKDKNTQPPSMPVKLNVFVTDETGRLVTDVRQEEMQVLEDGTPQTITYFSRKEGALNYGLVVDNSGSVRSQLSKLIQMGHAIVTNNRPGDKTFLVRFISSDKIQTVQDFTSDQKILGDKLDDLYVEGGQTAISDAVYLSAKHLMEYKIDQNTPQRRALILITDGVERSSYYKLRQISEQLYKLDSPIFVIGFVKEIQSKRERERAIDFLNRLALETGGSAYFPDSPAQFPGIAKNIALEMRSQYVIGYNSTNPTRDGSYRKLQVIVADGPGGVKRHVFVRSGYTAPRK